MGKKRDISVAFYIIELVYKGKGMDDIIKETGFTKTQIKNYIKILKGDTKNEIMSLLKNNGENKKEQFVKTQEEKGELKKILLDASACNRSDIYDVLLQADEVYLTKVTIEEMEHHKKDDENSFFSKAVRYVLKNFSEDIAHKKYKCAKIKICYRNDNDKTILTAWEEGMVLVTGDNGMASRAKVEGIPYYIPGKLMQYDLEISTPQVVFFENET